MSVTRLNYTALYVRDLDRSVGFYCEAWGFTEVTRMLGFSRTSAPRTTTTTDLGLFAIGAQALSPPHGSTGLSHLA